MVELPPRAQRVLDAARGADDPTPDERARADAAVRSALAAVGVANLPPLEAAPAEVAGPRSGAPSVPRAGLRLALQLGLAAAGSSIALLLLVPALSRTTSEPAEMPARPAMPSKDVTDGPANPPKVAPASSPERADGADEGLHPSARERAQHLQSNAAPADDALQAEVALISEASRLLQEQRFPAALRVLREHERRFRSGALKLEREALFVLVLCSTGPSERARHERDRFLRSASDSVLAERVRVACADSLEAPL